ncbi:MAG: hypothetical protein HOE90_17150 [Bacteriovoracaceae bacterium]|nr:hypothetical protein [Bacteriovoracaceae bacterium]
MFEKQLSLPHLIEEYLEFRLERAEFQGAEFFVIKQDGHLLFKSLKSSSAAAIGALCAGAWQAASAISGFFTQPTDGVFRLSFDQPGCGIYVIPLTANSYDLYMGVLFENVDNPGKLKNKVRTLSVELMIYLEEKQITEAPETSKRDEFLFKDISDDEIDSLFSI